MSRSIALVFLLALPLFACSDDPSVTIPTVAPGAYEADCQRLCTLAEPGNGCTAKHAELCLADCRARTNGLPAACAQCLIDGGTVIHQDVDVFDDPACDPGGPTHMSACMTECDDGGGGAPSPDLAVVCDLVCGFYGERDTVFACSADNSADCRTTCAATIAANSRVCAQCAIENVLYSTVCINDECDCTPDLSTSPESCPFLCDNLPPQT